MCGKEVTLLRPGEYGEPPDDRASEEARPLRFARASGLGSRRGLANRALLGSRGREASSRAFPREAWERWKLRPRPTGGLRASSAPPWAKGGRVRETHHLRCHSNGTPASSRTSVSPEPNMVRFTRPTLLQPRVGHSLAAGTIIPRLHLLGILTNQTSNTSVATICYAILRLVTLLSKNLHVRLRVVAIVPGALYVGRECRQVLLDGRGPQTWVVLLDAKHIVNVKYR